MTRYKVELTDEQAQALAQPPGMVALHPADQAIDALRNAIRANPPKPPRMAEPDWGEKVRASTVRHAPRRTLLRVVPVAGSSRRYWQAATGALYEWDELIDPEPWRAES